MASIKLRRKWFTESDDLSELMEMKDSDVLAEEPRTEVRGGDIALSGTLGALGIGGYESLRGLIKGAIKKGAYLKKGETKISRLKSAGRGFGRGALRGSLIGAGLGSGIAYLVGRKQAKINKKYNESLETAKTGARRRLRRSFIDKTSRTDDYTD